ncbi:MAG: hypothetical protein WBC20_13720 [Candidatus Aminicenantaceae bacterium]
MRIKGVDIEVKFSETTLTDNLYVDIQYKWKTKSNFLKMDIDYIIFVHFWHRSNLIVHDGHRPEIPTSLWEPDKEYTYSRKIYIPAFIDALDPEFKGEETLELSIGFSSPYDGPGDSMKKILVKKLKFVPPPPDIPKIIYGDGWYDLEINPETLLKRWRWTGKEARCIIDNPKQDALLVIKGGVNKEIFHDQKVIFKIKNVILDEFTPEGNYFQRSFKIKKEILGEAEKFDLVISIDKTFIPAKVILRSKDERELGIQISFIYFR